MIVQCATFTKSLNPRNIEKSVSDILIRIRSRLKTVFGYSVSGCKLTIRDGTDRKLVPAVRTASAVSARCLHRLCCTLPCPCCTTIPKFYPQTAMAICSPSPEALCFS